MRLLCVKTQETTEAHVIAETKMIRNNFRDAIVDHIKSGLTFIKNIAKGEANKRKFITKQVAKSKVQFARNYLKHQL